MARVINRQFFMRTRTRRAVGFIAAWLVLATGVLDGRGQGTAFTYQGSLQDGSAPASGTYDFRFTAYDSATNGAQIGGPVTNAGVGLSNGIFTTTPDFGANVFNGRNVWLDIGVRTNGASSFSPLAPRQQVTASPYAILSGTAGRLASNYFSGDIAADSNGVVTLKATGTPGTYYKTTFDAQGREISGAASLLSADVPNLDWSKITSGKPSNLAGYGITDAVPSASFGALTNSLGTIFNVKSFGAVGDGIANDTAAISNAFRAWTNSPSGGVLYFPAGSYLDTATHGIFATAPDGTPYQSGWVSNNFQVSRLSIAGDGMGSSFWLGDVTNATFLAITNAGVFVRDLSFVCPHPGSSGASTGVAQWGGNGNGQAQYHRVGFINWLRDGFYMNSFATQINGCTALSCGTGFNLADFCDEAELDVNGFYCTNAVVMLSSPSPQYGVVLGNIGLNRAVRLRVNGTGDNIGVIVGGLTIACNITGGFESVSNCAIAIGHPPYLGPLYGDSVFGIDCTIRDFYLQSSGTNPVIRLYNLRPGALTLENVSQIGSPYMVISMTNLADPTTIATLHTPFNELLSDGTFVGQSPDPAASGGLALINQSFGVFGGTNLNLQVDTAGNLTSRALATAQWLKFSGSTPTVAINTSGAGAGAVVSLDAAANDSRGVIKLVTGTGVAPNARLCTISFGATKPGADEVVMLTPMNNQPLAGSRMFTTNFTTTGFEIWSGASAPADNTTNVVGYLCIQ